MMMIAINQRNVRYTFSFLVLFFSMSTSVLATTFTWQGPYVGASLGGGFGNNQMSTNVGSVSDASYFTTSDDINAVNHAGTSTKHPSALIAGIQAGHDWAWKQIVYGVAFDYSTLSLKSSSTALNTYPDNSDEYSVYTSVRTNWLFTFRGRVGYQTVVHLPSLFYFTGGVAMTKLKVSNNFSDNSVFMGTGASSTSQNQIGWTAGAGIEVAAFNHMSVDFEYLYVGVPSVKTMGSIYNTEGGFGFQAQSMNSAFSSTANFHATILKIGLNYRFDE